MNAFVVAVGLVLLATGCGGSSDSNTITVQPGESIQAAVNAAPAGSRIVVMPGEYVETHGGQAAVLVEKSLQLIGSREGGGAATILPGPGNTEGILVRGTADAFIENVLIEGFTIDGFSENGIWTYYVRDFEIRENNVGNSDHVGIYQQLSAQGLVRDNTAFGGRDSAMWVSGSESIRVLDNTFYGAPLGLQVNLSKDMEVERTTAYDNVVGLALNHHLSSGLDDVSLGFGYLNESVRLADSNAYDNNLPNPVSGGLVGQLPTGIGLLIAGHDGSYVENNTLTDNNYAGLALIDWCLATGDTDPDCKPDDNTIVGNTITGNGSNPPDHPFADLAGDVIVLGAGDNNCMADNIYDTEIGAGTIEQDSCPPWSEE